MADVTDQNLIRAYVRGRCEQSFGELVHRHVDLVHSTALRVVRDASLAEDVTQRVFLTLARHSVNLQERFSLTGWLHETARNLAINTVRGEERRRPAQKRVARALDRLRGILTEGGLTVPTASLTALLSTQAVQSAPVGLAASAITAVSATSAILPATSTLPIIMASTKAKIGLGLVLAASVTTPLVLQHQINTRLRDEIARLRAEPAPPPVQAAPSDTAELERLRGEHDELLRLRGQVSQLRQQVANQPKAPTKAISDGRNKADDRGAFELENARTLLAKAPEIPMIQRNEFRNAGYATSLASFDTMNWAAANRNTNAMFNAIGLESKARKRADELFAQMPEPIRQKYGSVDALLVDWRMNLAEAPEAYRVLSQREDGPDAAILTVQFQYPNSRVRENDLSFYRDQSGVWRQAMPPQVMDKLPYVISSQATNVPP